MEIGHISFRLAGTDGVSLETAKIVTVLNKMGHNNYYFAGELDKNTDDQGLVLPAINGSMLVPEAHFTHPEAVWITQNAFGTREINPELNDRIETLAGSLVSALNLFIDRYKIDLLTVQNVFAIPMNLALSLAIYRVIKNNGMPVIAHNHDFYWEREIYKTNCVADILDTCFPPNLANVQQVVINSQALRELEKRGIKSTVLPNIFDFNSPPPAPDNFNAYLRSSIGLAETDLLFLQPTRVIPRKGIELAFELVHRLGDLPIKLLITHSAEYNTMDYLEKISSLAEKLQVDLLYLPALFQPQRQYHLGKHKIFSLWDAYIYADFVTYPSLYEGFGNALLETIYFRKPLLVNRYSVYQDDIEPTGLKAVTIEGMITEQSVKEVRSLLNNPAQVKRMTETNFQVASKHFSYETARDRLERVIKALHR